jgi:hypothetical protein
MLRVYDGVTFGLVRLPKAVEFRVLVGSGNAAHGPPPRTYRLLRDNCNFPSRDDLGKIRYLLDD